MNGDLKYYTDTLIVETIAGDPAFLKKADLSETLSGIVSSIKEYVTRHIDPKDKTGSIIDMLAPGAISGLFDLFGFSKLGWLFGTAASALHIDIASLVRPLWDYVKGALSGGQKAVSGEIDNIVSKLSHSDSSEADDSETKLAQTIRYARILRLSMEYDQHQMLRLTKNNLPPNKLFSLAASRGARTTNLILSVLGWLFKTVLIAGGFMVAGDLANKMLGQPNALDGTYQAGQEPTPEATPASNAPTQTKFPLNTSFHNTPAPKPWVENISNDPESIQDMLINFTKQVYSGLDGHENWIISSPTFQAVKNHIVWHNHTASGEPMVYIPANYASKKSLVDKYIGEVAENDNLPAPTVPPPSPAPSSKPSTKPTSPGIKLSPHRDVPA